HGHYDHVGDTVAIARRTGATVIANPEISAWCVRQGLKTQPLQYGAAGNFPFGSVRLTEAVHSSNLPDGSNGGNASGFIITTLDEKKIYLAGDTGLFDGMKAIGAEDVDFAAIPIGGYYTIDPAQALSAVKIIHPKVVMPIHFNTFDKIKQNPEKWAERVRAETSSRVVVLKPGESVEI
ncbi:metal-dependent hydrolase, partial [bacterium]|nr:metal-dependent hydrolase [bacterium]